MFTDAAALATELSAVEGGIRVPGLSPDVAADLGRRQQLAYRALNRHPEWIAVVQELVDPVAAGPLSLHLMARQAQVDHASGKPPVDPPAVLPAWTIVAPLPIDELRADYDAAEAATGVPWEYLAAINFQETRMGRIVGASSAGAVGPMQFLPSTWAKCCSGDPTVPRDAIIGAATYLAQNGAPADMHAALLQYNPNEGYVGAVTAYAQNLMADERALVGYRGWDVFYASSAGTVRLPVGYGATEPIDAATYVRDHPEDLLPDS
jgi:Transglycosylase SLT domain